MDDCYRVDRYQPHSESSAYEEAEREKNKVLLALGIANGQIGLLKDQLVSSRRRNRWYAFLAMMMAVSTVLAILLLVIKQ